MNWAEMGAIEFIIVSILSCLAMMAGFIAILTGFAYWWDRFDSFNEEDLQIHLADSEGAYGSPRQYKSVEDWQYVKTDKSGSRYLTYEPSKENRIDFEGIDFAFENIHEVDHTAT